MQNRIRGAIYGLLIGDAVGVPYEFHSALQLPPYSHIDMIPPQDFRRTYPDVPIGTWSDDGAQALCLLASLLHCQKLDSIDFANRIRNWYRYGYMAVDYQVFDIGVQTAQALQRYEAGVSVEEMANTDEHSNGNGALMRTLPLALWHRGSDQQLVELAYQQSHLTHAHLRSKICCALYCLWAKYLLKGQPINEAWESSISILMQLYKNSVNEQQELNHIIDSTHEKEISGSGYVVDCLHSAHFALQQNNYEDVIKTAIALGQDTDTTACVAGGLAGIMFGYEGIPQIWVQQLRGKEVLEPLLTQLEEA
ncbi:ADP-ribosylglycohydrolase family protein [Acinetobacter nosocomialis]|uniref:ADP-ribosylglycohydrolase family protein n=1 Tax=Acinetobacter nosocomialis TaxID=106654 RepID=UPI0026ECBB2C|nr:ADP-ribosylglycohydrolase family protein [Acinetobacter nosocomialis]MDO7217417.1 ADP-ribosylglycohydrolase family protein [Acinetobacter nosocomialis]